MLADGRPKKEVGLKGGSFGTDRRAMKNRSMSAMPRKRRLAAKASSVAMGQNRPSEPFQRHEEPVSFLRSCQRDLPQSLGGTGSKGVIGGRHFEHRFTFVCERHPQSRHRVSAYRIEAKGANHGHKGV